MYTTKVLKREQKIKLKWLIGQGVKTPPSHGGNRGSIPLLAVGKLLGTPGSFFVLCGYALNANHYTYY